VAVPLRVLIVEDSEMDATLLIRELNKNGYSPVYQRVDSAEAMEQALKRANWEIILCDYVMPGFGGLEAIKLLHQKGLDIPLIIVSGNVGEDAAVEAMKTGAQDYVMKGNWKRLIPAIQREIIESGNRKEKRRAEENLKKLSRAREVLIKANESIMRALSEEVLLKEVCRTIVESGGYRMCWIGYAKQDEKKTVLPVAQSGFVEGYLQTVSFSWEDSENGRGPTGTSIRTCKPIITRNIHTDPMYTPWREEALMRGYASSISLPLMDKGQVLGVLNIYASDINHFDTDEVQLLLSLASDLAFGILALRTRIECDLAETELRHMAHKLVQMQEEERRSIARELHDQIGQSLTGLKLLMNEVGRSQLAKDRMAILDESQSIITELIQQVREMSLKLRPSMLDDLGLLPTLLWHFEHYTKQTKIKVNFDHLGLERIIAPDTATAIYRIIQEALNNAAKYAKVNQVDVSLRANEGGIKIYIEDRGCGFDIASVSGKASSGLSGMRERAQLLGGKLNIVSFPGQGVKIVSEFPHFRAVRTLNESSKPA
jgi:signal transduction histidine kinase